MVAITRSKIQKMKLINQDEMKEKLEKTTHSLWLQSLNSKPNLIFTAIGQHLIKFYEYKTRDERKNESIEIFRFIKNNWEYIQDYPKFCDAVKEKLIQFYYNDGFEEFKMFFEFFGIEEV